MTTGIVGEVFVLRIQFSDAPLIDTSTLCSLHSYHIWDEGLIQGLRVRDYDEMFGIMSDKDADTIHIEWAKESCDLRFNMWNETAYGKMYITKDRAKAYALRDAALAGFEVGVQRARHRIEEHLRSPNAFHNVPMFGYGILAPRGALDMSRIATPNDPDGKSNQQKTFGRFS